MSRAQHSAAAGFEQRQRVRLLIVEVTTTEEILPCHLPYRFVEPTDVVLQEELLLLACRSSKVQACRLQLVFMLTDRHMQCRKRCSKWALPVMTVQW